MKENVTECSSYLKDIENRYGQELFGLSKDSKTALDTVISSIEKIDPNTSVSQQLRSAKALFSYRWALARIERSVDPEELGRLQTRLAEVTINKALQAAWSEKKFQRTLAPGSQNLDGNIPGLFVLGLGKLGGFDLNFSSDVDLIAFYDPETLPVLEMHGRMDVCVRVLKRMTQILTKVEENEFVWRVDWRLRPDASVNQIAMSTQAAQEFYFFHSLPWHRLAMIKARPIAGDLEAGDRFLAELAPYLWRQNLDYRMVDEIYLLKEKINQEHPQLKLARLQRNQALPEAAATENAEGFNLKLGAGGIREIEFIVNALQLLWGGKKPAARVPSTLSALRALCDEELIDKTLAQKLETAYIFLRRAEDALQIRGNEQIHQLPTTVDQLNQVLFLLNDGSLEAFLREIERHRNDVLVAFDDLFKRSAPQENMPENEDAQPAWIDELEPKQKKTWQGWANGFSNYAVAPNQYPMLGPLLRSLRQKLDSDGADRNATIAKIDSFFMSIPRGGQYLRLLAEHPRLLEDIIDPLFYSPHMTELLTQSPHIVDHLLESDPEDVEGFDSEFVLQSKDVEIRQERLRRFVNEQLYSAYLKLIRGQVGAVQTQNYLTRLAEHVIGLGINITSEEMGMSEAPIAILGMGKLGMGAMAPMSDLDLIFIADDTVELEVANVFSRRFQSLMEVRSREGRAYEMDTRLRPSGRSGPVTVSLTGFRDYQIQNAKTWEHIALVAGRPIAGNHQLLRDIGDVRADVLARSRNLEQFKLDAAKMLWRLREQRIGKSEEVDFDVKLRSGGLMELDYMSACSCLIQTPLPCSLGLSYDEMIRETWPDNTLENLRNATFFWRKLQVWTRLLGIDTHSLKQLPDNLATPLFRDMEVLTAEELVTFVTSQSVWVNSQLNALFDEVTPPEDWQDWLETPVKWIDHASMK